MSNFAIVTDSSCDLSKEFRRKHNIEYAKMLMSYTKDNGELFETFLDLDWEVLSSKEFYDILRSGKRIFTAQVTLQNYLELFEQHLKEGRDVLYVACSSGLSDSINAAILLVNTELKDKYPNNKVIIVDTLRAGMAEGMSVMLAVELREQGKTIEEVAEVLEKEKTSFKEVGIPENLSYLKRAGRVSGPKALMGDLIGLKPILMFDEKGSNEATHKAIGKKKAFIKMAELIKEDIVDPENQTIYLMNADCRAEDIEAFKKAILERVTVKEIICEPLGPVIGACSGPGTIICNYKGRN